MAAPQEQGITTYAGPQALTTAPTDWNEIQRVFAGMVQKNANANEVVAAMIVCKNLGFNPVLNHIFLIKGAVYVSHKGLLNLAHRSGVFDGIEVLEQGENQTHYIAKVAVYRKDMTRPFTYTGRYPKAGDRKQYGPEMAITRAETMALRRAFDVGLPVKEEIDALEGEYRVSEAAAPVADPLLAVGPMSEGSYAELWDEINRMGSNKTPSKEIVATIRMHQPELDEARYTAVMQLGKAIIEARKAGQAWVERARQPDATTQEIIEAEVVVTAAEVVVAAPTGRRVLDHETFAEVQHSIASMAHHGSADSEIKAYMSPFWKRASDDQRGVIEKLWERISAARQAGEAWPDPDAELQAELAYGQDEIGEPSGDPSLVDDSPFANGAPASIAG